MTFGAYARAWTRWALAINLRGEAESRGVRREPSKSGPVRRAATATCRIECRPRHRSWACFTNPDQRPQIDWAQWVSTIKKDASSGTSGESHVN